MRRATIWIFWSVRKLKSHWLIFDHMKWSQPIIDALRLLEDKIYYLENFWKYLKFILDMFPILAILENVIRSHKCAI